MTDRQRYIALLESLGFSRLVVMPGTRVRRLPAPTTPTITHTTRAEAKPMRTALVAEIAASIIGEKGSGACASRDAERPLGGLVDGVRPPRRPDDLDG